jgi:hypothetical protein
MAGDEDPQPKGLSRLALLAVPLLTGLSWEWSSSGMGEPHGRTRVSDKLENEAKWHRREIARLLHTIDKVKSDAAYGEQQRETLSSLDWSLQLLRERLAALEGK